MDWRVSRKDGNSGKTAIGTASAALWVGNGKTMNVAVATVCGMATGTTDNIVEHRSATGVLEWPVAPSGVTAFASLDGPGSTTNIWKWKARFRAAFSV